MISVIVATYNRPEKLKSCLGSILRNSFSKYEILVVDQSKNSRSRKVVDDFKKTIIRYYRLERRGKSKALNFAISKARGEIVAFTDDDCVVGTNWLREINHSFNKLKEISGVFGMTKPNELTKKEGAFCPATFTRKKARIIKGTNTAWGSIGSGNNMAFRKEVFDEIGGFREWLGPGVFIDSAEDAEFTLRMLLCCKKLFYNPKAVIYHNRWLNRKEYEAQGLAYFFGVTAVHAYFAGQKKNFAKKVIKKTIRRLSRKFKRAFRLIIYYKPGKYVYTKSVLRETFYFIFAVFWGFYYSLVDPLT